MRNSQLLNISNSEVFGINQVNHLSRVQQDSYDSLISSIFLNSENWIFDFFEYMGSDSKRTEEVKRLRD
jgi:hypothetical protein